MCAYVCVCVCMCVRVGRRVGSLCTKYVYAYVCITVNDRERHSALYTVCVFL